MIAIEPSFLDMYLIIIKGCGIIASVLATLWFIFVIGTTIYSSFKSWLDSNWP